MYEGARGSIDGSHGTDRLNDQSGRSTLTVTGNQTGRLDGVDYRGFEEVNLGSENDTANLENGAGGSIDGSH